MLPHDVRLQAPSDHRCRTGKGRGERGVARTRHSLNPSPSRDDPRESSRLSEVKNPVPAADFYTEKYFACGWWTTMAEVDCSGSSWSSSLSWMPISSALSSARSCSWSARLGQAG